MARCNGGIDLPEPCRQVFRLMTSLLIFILCSGHCSMSPGVARLKYHRFCPRAISCCHHLAISSCPNHGSWQPVFRFQGRPFIRPVCSTLAAGGSDGRHVFCVVTAGTTWSVRLVPCMGGVQRAR
ncbi:hypothetical protein B0T11DRAFT_58184 [Plectosphaerella cucumerina]|uniref:Secreted protein n=1 Tax=Plectosphaerella cucumerina TaxID=40658 RepID=A0A8K0X5G7_9PEZI|nr:hypothetical protein B0T11DRAFT_58184 [Plectosphaerella cucumerina]